MKMLFKYEFFSNYKFFFTKKTKNYLTGNESFGFRRPLLHVSNVYQIYVKILFYMVKHDNILGLLEIWPKTNVAYSGYVYRL